AYGTSGRTMRAQSALERAIETVHPQLFRRAMSASSGRRDKYTSMRASVSRSCSRLRLPCASDKAGPLAASGPTDVRWDVSRTMPPYGHASEGVREPHADDEVRRIGRESDGYRSADRQVLVHDVVQAEIHGG